MYKIVRTASTRCIVPLGMPDVAPVPQPVARADEGVTVLFVRPMEARKGSGVLLSAIDPVLARHPRVRFRIIGNDAQLMSGA